RAGRTGGSPTRRHRPPKSDPYSAGRETGDHRDGFSAAWPPSAAVNLIVQGTQASAAKIHPLPSVVGAARGFHCGAAYTYCMPLRCVTQPIVVSIASNHHLVSRCPVEEAKRWHGRGHNGERRC